MGEYPPTANRATSELGSPTVAVFGPGAVEVATNLAALLDARVTTEYAPDQPSLVVICGAEPDDVTSVVSTLARASVLALVAPDESELVIMLLYDRGANLVSESDPPELLAAHAKALLRRVGWTDRSVD